MSQRGAKHRQKERDREIARHLRRLGQAVDQARKDKDLTIERLAALAGVSPRMVAYVLTGADLSLSTLIKLAWALDLDVAVVPWRTVGGITVALQEEGPPGTLLARATANAQQLAERLGFSLPPIEAAPPIKAAEEEEVPPLMQITGRPVPARKG